MGQEPGVQGGKVESWEPPGPHYVMNMKKSMLCTMMFS